MAVGRYFEKFESCRLHGLVEIKIDVQRNAGVAISKYSDDGINMNSENITNPQLDIQVHLDHIRVRDDLYRAVRSSGVEREGEATCDTEIEARLDGNGARQQWRRTGIQ